MKYNTQVIFKYSTAMALHGSYNQVEGERLVQKHLLKTLTEEEHCSLHTVVDQYLKRLCELRSAHNSSEVTN